MITLGLANRINWCKYSSDVNLKLIKALSTKKCLFPLPSIKNIKDFFEKIIIKWIIITIIDQIFFALGVKSHFELKNFYIFEVLSHSY